VRAGLPVGAARAEAGPLRELRVPEEHVAALDRLAHQAVVPARDLVLRRELDVRGDVLPREFGRVAELVESGHDRFAEALWVLVLDQVAPGQILAVDLPPLVGDAAGAPPRGLPVIQESLNDLDLPARRGVPGN